MKMLDDIIHFDENDALGAEFVKAFIPSTVLCGLWAVWRKIESLSGHN